MKNFQSRFSYYYFLSKEASDFSAIYEPKFKKKLSSGINFQCLKEVISKLLAPIINKAKFNYWQTQKKRKSCSSCSNSG